MKRWLLWVLIGIWVSPAAAQNYGYGTPSKDKTPADRVNPFIGTTHYGVTNPGAMVPQGLMSVTPFNVMGSPDNRRDKDDSWWSAPYEFRNSYLTGFSHVNLSGVGCPDMGSLLVMATTGELEVDYTKYGCGYDHQYATPGYYSVELDNGIRAEATATARVGLTRFVFPEGRGNILLNLGEGLTNETGAWLRRVSETQVEGMKLMGTFCSDYGQKVFPVYFVLQVSTPPAETGYWKYQRPEFRNGEWKYKTYTEYAKDLAGDSIGAWFGFDCTESEAIEVKMAVSFVSVENARENLAAEVPGWDFDRVRSDAHRRWNDDLGRVLVEGGTDDQKTIFYTGLYHMLVHPNILQDVNGQYPAMEGTRVLHTDEQRWTVFSLWDTYRNVHQLFTLLYPDRQESMVRTMIEMQREWGWMPKWELYGRESFTMEGDPASIVVADTWLRGVRGFDVETAYEAMLRSALTPGAQNLLRPDNDDYLQRGYIPLRSEFDNSVSHALEYYVADFSIGRLAAALGKKKEANMFADRAKGWRHYYDPSTGALRPRLPDGKFLTPFDPLQGANWEPSPGFHEGNAWNYTFAVPHDIEGLVRIMGGPSKFTERLQSVFDNGWFDVTNEPDFAYAHLFSQVAGEEWRTQKIVRELLDEHFTNTPHGLPGNDDAGTMSGWAVLNMIGIFPDCPGRPDFTVVTPLFERITLRLDPRYYPSEQVVIRVENPGAPYIDRITVDGRPLKGYRITHDELTSAREIVFHLRQ